MHDRDARTVAEDLGDNLLARLAAQMGEQGRGAEDRHLLEYPFASTGKPRAGEIRAPVQGGAADKVACPPVATVVG